MKWIVLALVVVSVTTVFAKRCETGDDCEEDECCLNYVSFGGHCQKLTPEGQSCTPLVNDVEKKPDMYHFQCPCKEGLKCVPKHGEVSHTKIDRLEH
ncbi:hypothetical protein AVEN_5366-1 [Araneus ventricosus]|uniref:Prokineticin domain-containing protein n=1 Tax=Araneus ventricosus TaxID=182803 RepID=A0A4Y2X604_ARAVE|nr:hypothetical protein AVEN_5366-1 [Araneus ventricosus]